MTSTIDVKVALLSNYLLSFLLHTSTIFVIVFYENGNIPSDPHVSLELLMQAFLSSFCITHESQHNISVSWSGVSSVSNYGVDFLLLYLSFLHPLGVFQGFDK